MFYSTPLFYPPSQSLTFHQNTLPQYTTLIRPDEPSSVEAPSSTQQPSQISYAAKVAGSDSYKQERSESRGYKNYTKSHASPLHALSKPNQEHHPSGTPNDPEPGSELWWTLPLTDISQYILNDTKTKLLIIDLIDCAYLSRTFF